MIFFLEGILHVLRFFFGACIFSFLNVVVDRLPRGESVIYGRSHCVSCGHTLTRWELIPCISYIALGGKCKECGSRIPIRDFLTECIGGAVCIYCSVRFGCGSLGLISLKGTVVFMYLGILLVVALIDQDTQMIYDRFHILILALAVVSMFIFLEHGFLDRMLGAVIVSLPMFVLALLVAGAFGGGDIKLMAVSGFFLGTASTVVAMFLAVLTGGGYAAYMLMCGKMERKAQFAFGPFLALGLAAAAFWGDTIAKWYAAFL